MPAYRVSFFAHCGMLIPIEDKTDRADARQIAARIIRSRRRTGHTVTTIDRGRSWESNEPDDAIMIPDTAGRLDITRIPYAECCECGAELEDISPRCKHAMCESCANPECFDDDDRHDDDDTQDDA